MSQNVPSWQRKLRKRVKAEPGKAALLGALMLVLLIVAAKAMLFSGSIPAPAAAATGGVKPLPAPPPAAPINPASAALATWLEQRFAPSGRNLFLVKLDYFPQDAAAMAAMRDPDGAGFWDQLAKSMVQRADQETKRKLLIDKLCLEAKQLELQSTMVSQGKPRALVNGAMVGEGDVVAGFRLVKIEARRIIIEREGIKLEVLNR